MPRKPIVPAIFRRKRGVPAKEYGSYYCKVKGVEICLKTHNVDRAYSRAAAAMKGVRTFVEDADEAAEAALRARDRTPPPPPPVTAGELEAARAAAEATVLAERQREAAPPASPSPATAAPPASPPVQPSASEAPPPAPPSSAAPAAPPAPPPAPPSTETPPHEAATEAAREATQERDTAPPPPPPAPELDPAFLAMICKQGAEAIVDLQLLAQGWIVWKRTGDKPGKVPPEALAAPKQIWEGQLKIWAQRFALDSIPPWVVALVLTSMAMPIQYAGRQKPKSKGSLGEPMDAEWSEIHRPGANGATDHRKAA